MSGQVVNDDFMITEPLSDNLNGNHLAITELWFKASGT